VRTPLHRPVCDLLGCRYPVVLAGMGGVARSALVRAVTDAGGFGFLGMVREPPELIESEVRQVRAHTGQPFGVNIIPAATEPGLLQRQIDACLTLRVPVVCLFWDIAEPVIRRFRDHGVVVVCQVGSAAEAAAAERAGAEALIAQGVEAGGHVRGDQPLERLVPAIAEITDLPVLAAGGLADGADLVGVLSLGAQGGVFGTAMIATTESFAHDYHKARIVEARDGDTLLSEIFHVNWPAGAKVRTLHNSVTDGAHGDPHGGERVVIGHEGDRPIYLFSTDSPLRSMTGDFEAMALYAGTSCGRIDRIAGAREKVEAIVAQAHDLIGLPAPAARPAARYASPACSAHEMEDSYMGYATTDELLNILNELLEAERAGARLTRRTADQVSRPDTRELILAIHRDEARWCAVLAGAIIDLGGTPSKRTGDFLEKAMAIEDTDERLVFLNKGQAWVSRKLQTLLPTIRDAALHTQLHDMLTSHDSNIEKVAVFRGGAPVPAHGS